MRASVPVLVLLVAVLSSVAAFGQADKSVQLTLYPAAVSKPALRYKLLPPFLERRPGNAAVWWNRIPAEQTYFFREFYKENGPYEKLWKWQEMPLNDPAAKEYFKKEITGNDLGMIRPMQIYSDMTRAAQFESCDWELPVREGNALAVLLPEAQQLRSYARMLSLKARLEISEGKYGEAVRTLQVGYSLARHATQGETIVHALIGATIASIMSNEVRQWQQQSDAPNLYWALSTLPQPLLNFRLGGEFESNGLFLHFPELRDIDKKQLSPEGWRDLLDKMAVSLAFLNSSGNGEAMKNIVRRQGIRAILCGYPRAKRYLVERGRSAQEVEAMPVPQATLLYVVDAYQELSDEQFKWFFLPYADGIAQRIRDSRQLWEAENREIAPLASILLPAVEAFKRAEVRLQWDFAMLRIFEALRLYAASHNGQWPDQLSDITEVPIPLNPHDNKPFIYERHGDKALLTVEYGPVATPWRQEITFARKDK